MGIILFNLEADMARLVAKSNEGFRPLMGIILFNKLEIEVPLTEVVRSAFPSPNGDYFI